MNADFPLALLALRPSLAPEQDYALTWMGAAYGLTDLRPAAVQAADPLPSLAEIAAHIDTPAYLAWLRRRLIVELAAGHDPVLMAAWAEVPGSYLKAPTLMSAANQSRLAADQSAMAGAMATTEAAISAADSPTAARAALAAHVWPTLAGPEI